MPTPTSFTFEIAATGLYYLADLIPANAQKVAGTMSIHLVSDAFTGVVKVESRGNGAARTAGAASVLTSYVARHLNGAVKADTIETVDITGTSLILVPTSGQEPVLNCTARTAGKLVVHVDYILGAAA